jgi:hypothetical protein
MRRPGGFAAVVLALAIGLAACGGDDGDEVSPAPGAEGAEQRVKEFVTAEFQGDSETACGYVADELQDQIAETFGSCEQLVDTIGNVVESEGATFEDVPIKISEIDSLELETKLDGEDRAVVTGPKGRQKYALEVIDGEWTITFISTD